MNEGENSDPYKTPKSNPVNHSANDSDTMNFLITWKIRKKLNLDRKSYKRHKKELFKENNALSKKIAPYVWICIITYFTTYFSLKYLLDLDNMLYSKIIAGVLTVVLSLVLFGYAVNPHLYKALKAKLEKENSQ